jgi:hypothetical protein
MCTVLLPPGVNPTAVNVYRYIRYHGPTVLSIVRAFVSVMLVQIYVIPSLIGRCYIFTRCVLGMISTSHRLYSYIPSATPDDASSCLNYTVAHVHATKAYKESRGMAPLLTLTLDGSQWLIHVPTA